MYADIHPAEIYPFSNMTDTGLVKRVLIPLFTETIAAGFPSPAEDYVEMMLDLNELCIQHPVSTFFVRARGQSMTGAGIQPGDLLVVDKSLEAHNDSIVVAVLDGEFTLKRLQVTAGNQYFLLPDNPDFRPIEIKEGMEFEIWGVVVLVIHFFGPAAGKQPARLTKPVQKNK
jgi:DNA polymerase V